MQNANLKNILNNLPISINAQLGDPFQPTQWENTLEKLRKLEQEQYIGPVALITKSILSDEQISIIEKINLDIFVFLSITGLNENKKATFAEISENYLKLCKTGKMIAIFIRPIIPGYNDSLDIIEPILNLAANGSKTVIIRGYKDIFKLDENTFISPDFLQEVKHLCSTYNLKVYDKTAHFVADLRPNHFLNTKNISSGTQILQHLGYPVRLNNDGQIILAADYQWSQGDLNFIRMVTGETVHATTKGKDAIMTIFPNGVMLDCSSSWFGWARRIPCAINCWYCISKVTDFNSHKEASLGCIPTELIK